MNQAIFLAVGAVAGGLLVYAFLSAARRRRASVHQRDPLYAATRYAAVTRLRRHGTLTLTSLKGSVDLPGHTLERYLDLMEREGLIRRHGHQRDSQFYTRP